MRVIERETRSGFGDLIVEPHDETTSVGKLAKKLPQAFKRFLKIRATIRFEWMMPSEMIN